jgi:hypothetical protein
MVGAGSLVPLSHLVDVCEGFNLVYLFVLVRSLCFADYIAEVTGRGVSPGEPVLLSGYLVVGIPPGVACTLAESPFSRGLICKGNGFSELVCKEV